VNGLFVNTANARRMRRVYAKLTAWTQSFDDLLYDTKRLIMDTSMASELNVLAEMLNRISESNRKSRDFTLNSLHDVIVEVVACFPAYRTYVTEQGWAPEDRAVVERAIVRARRRNPAMDPTIFDFFREVLLPRDPEDPSQPSAGNRRGSGYPPADAAESAARLRFSMKFQQYTGPLQAKGLEDTAFYRYNLLLSLNEVGGDPSKFGHTGLEFHELNRLRRDDWRYEMLATATHDTKVGEDVRTRIDVLSEMPDEWGREVSRWMRLNRALRPIVDGEPVPDRNDEYRFYQALLGVWPPEADDPSRMPDTLVDRLKAYMNKAVKEAKLHSSWINPDEAYEQGVATFIERALAPNHHGKFLAAFLPFQQRIARSGMVNSLAQVVLKIASPGVPDFYQGTDLWEFSLVDPDNRRPVDFARRDAALAECARVAAMPADARAPEIGALLDRWSDGTIKMFITSRALQVRRDDPDLFLEGDYLPLDVESTVPAQLLAFARMHLDGRAAIAIVPHLTLPLVDRDHALPLGDRWKTSRVLLPTALSTLAYRDVFTGAELKPVTTAEHSWLFAGQVFERLPVALLVSE
jgi:(1->4)-alpha-D-glucan 1-alpha-D-glucosylmutase